MQIRFAADSDSTVWNEFVIENTPSAFFSLYNLFEWRKILENTYGYTSPCLIAEQNGKIAGCFPLTHVKSKLLGSRLVSTPFTDHGCGPISNTQHTQVLRSMIETSRKLALDLKVQAIQINSPQESIAKTLSEYGYRKHYDYFTFILDITQSIDSLWRNFRKHARNSIRKAEKNGVEVVEGCAENCTETIHKIHVDNMKRLGTPPHSKKFFVEMWRQMRPKGQIKVYFAKSNGIDIAAVVLFPHRESVRWGVGALVTEYRQLNPLYLVLWKAINWSQQEGYHTFDMGGSRKDSGNFSFKEGWIGKNQANGRIVELNHLHLFLKEGKTDVVNPQNPKYSRLSHIWRSCVPLSVANNVGPYLRKQIAM